jgi:lactoylglutathione lyase
MSRVQLALNVRNLEEVINFYSKMFNAQPAKVREGYANFAIAEPPLKVVLIETSENADEFHHLNHLGVGVESTSMVEDAIQRFDEHGLVEKVEKNETCCFAVQDKVWVSSPDGAKWEYYTVLADSPVESLANGSNATCKCC